MDKNECLFVGGPWDGRRLSVNEPLRVVRCPVPTEAHGVLDKNAKEGSAPFSAMEYRRNELRARDGKEYIVYEADDASGVDLIGRLIAGYSAHPK